MPYAKKSHLLIAGTMLLVAGLTVACESDVERQMRLEREAMKEKGELEKLEGQLDTTNPDPYDPQGRGAIKRGSFKVN